MILSKEWTIGYIHAPWCKVCESNKSTIDEIIQENQDIDFIKIDASQQENEDFIKALDFESLPYYAVFHKDAPNANPAQPLTCFIGGETGGGKEIPMQIIGMIRQFQARNIV